MYSMHFGVNFFDFFDKPLAVVGIINLHMILLSFLLLL